MMQPELLTLPDFEIETDLFPRHLDSLPDDQGIADDDIFSRVPPYSLDAEQAVLGAVLMDGNIAPLVMTSIKPSHFYRPSHKVIFKAMCELFSTGCPVDLITVSEKLKEAEAHEEAGGRAYLNDLAISCSSTANALAHVDIIKQKSESRDVIAAAIIGLNAGFNATKPNEALSILQQATNAVAQDALNNDMVIASLTKQDNLDRLNAIIASKGKIQGVASGFHGVDTLLNGFKKGELNILAARPSMGKTAFALNIAHNAAIGSNLTTLFFSLEMGKEQLLDRMICSDAEIDSQRLRTGQLSDEDIARFQMANERVCSPFLLIDDSAPMTVSMMKAKAMKHTIMTQQTIGLIIVDYLQLLSGDGRDPNQRISTISRELKTMARELSCPVIALSQLSRGVESREDKRPMMSDLRDSGALEQDADNILFIYRDEYYNKGESPKAGIAEIIIAKQRNGPLGTVDLTFRCNITKFKNALDTYPPF